MCTAVSWNAGDHYFGRNLDLDYSYHETVTITPRYYPFRFLNLVPMFSHYAMIGMATVISGYPLYYEATNEAGLSMAGLNFPGLAKYYPVQPQKDNVATFELIPYVLSCCKTVLEARNLLGQINITDQAFNADYSPTPLHWMVSDERQSITVESTEEGLRIYDNPVGILTNNPPFDYHLFHLSSHLQVSANPAVNRFSDQMPLKAFSNGMGSIGLPGDYSSASRFVRSAFVKLNSKAGNTEEETVSQFFHILGSVSLPNGCVRMPHGSYEITRYSSCCNTRQGIYYYTTYYNSRVTAVNMFLEDLNRDKVIVYPLQSTPDFFVQNKS